MQTMVGLRSLTKHTNPERKAAMPTTGKYKGLKCGYEFELTPNRQASCIKCGHLYVKWVNYEELNRKYFHN